MDENRTEYRNRWQKEHKERVIVLVGKGQKDKIKNRAKEAGAGSLNAYIVGLIEADMGKLSEK